MFGSPDAAINQTFQLSGIPFTIIGTFKESVDTFGSTEIDDETILIPYSVARYFTGTDNVKDIFFSIRDHNDVEEAAKRDRSGRCTRATSQTLFTPPQRLPASSPPPPSSLTRSPFFCCSSPPSRSPSAASAS